MNKVALTVFVIIILAIVGFTLSLNNKGVTMPTLEEPVVVSNQGEDEVRAQVIGFGNKLKNVSLLAVGGEFRNQMNVNYKSYVSPSLIKYWEENPTLALGRNTSSPWPDRIEIVEVAKDANGSFIVEANVVEVSSADKPMEPSLVYPITLILLPQVDGKWMIASAEKGFTSELPKRITIEGRWECLPHRNTNGPQTMECAFGIVDGNNLHYAIDTLLMSTYQVDYSSGTRLRVEGVLTPVENLSSDTWKKYAIEGIISATSIQKI